MMRPKCRRFRSRKKWPSGLKIGAGDSITFDISGPKDHRTGREYPKDRPAKRANGVCLRFSPRRAGDGSADLCRDRADARSADRTPAAAARDASTKFPNVQIFDVADIVAAVQKLVSNFVLAISFVGSFVILSGILILIGSVALTKSQRIYENAILKTLGARRRTLAAILLAEYGLLGLLAGIIGSGFAVILSWAVSRYILDIEWTFDPVVPVLGILITAVLVMLVGSIASFDVLFRKPLATLRSQ